MHIIWVKLGHMCIYFIYIRELVDSLCRDNADMPMSPYIQKVCNRPNAVFVIAFLGS